jgi:hypothetical protein
MGVDASGVTNGKWRGVDKADASTLLHEGAQMALHVLGIIGFERAIMGLLERDEGGHDLGFDAAASDTSADAVPRSADHGATWGKLLPEIVYGTKDFKYTHKWNLLELDTD